MPSLDNHTAPAGQSNVEGEQSSCRRRPKHTLGNIQLRDNETNALFLIPTPSSDINDPLNWPQWRKYYTAGLICLAMLMCNFLAAGPSIAIVDTAIDFFPDAITSEEKMESAISKVAFFFTTTSLLQGTGCFFWIPMANKYGRRPVYIASYTLYFATALWLIFDKTYGGFLAARIVMGFGAGAAETIAPITIADVFFLHERGSIMSFYNCALSIGVAFGIVISGLITIDYHWRAIYDVACALIGFVLILAFLSFPETAYTRRKDTSEGSTIIIPSEKSSSSKSDAEELGQPADGTRKPSLWGKLTIWNGPLTSESLCRMFLRPFGLIILPPVLWAALIQAVTIGFLVAVSSNVDAAFEGAYDLEPYQVGLCFVSAIIGSLIGIPAGGHLGDAMADYFTKRNGGIREPEMRLPALILSLITTPLALVLFGAGIEYQLHWICPTIGLGLLNFSITQATNICLVYVIDAYRPVAGEVSLAVLGFKSLFGFLLSFYTNPWIDATGYLDAYGAMAGIAAAVLLMWIPFYVWELLDTILISTVRKDGKTFEENNRPEELQQERPNLESPVQTDRLLAALLELYWRLAVSLKVMHENGEFEAIREKLRDQNMVNLRAEAQKHPCIAVFPDIAILHACEATRIFQRLDWLKNISCLSHQRVLKMWRETARLLSAVRKMHCEAAHKAGEATKSSDDKKNGLKGKDKKVKFEEGVDTEGVDTVSDDPKGKGKQVVQTVYPYEEGLDTASDDPKGKGKQVAQTVYEYEEFHPGLNASIQNSYNEDIRPRQEISFLSPEETWSDNMY
ncbi:Fc.00g112680.m01.CDS01 [Cosmosporella sp. VM-42]